MHHSDNGYQQNCAHTSSDSSYTELRSIQKKGKMRFELFPGSPTPYLFDTEFHLLQALITK